MFELALAAYLIDKLFGELPCKHPVMFMGDFVQAFEKRFYQDSIFRGALLVLSLLLVTWLVSFAVIQLSALLPENLQFLVLAICASTGLAMNMLYSSVKNVAESDQPQNAVSHLVSRDTENMTENDAYKAALETWAENLSDGVIAPLFYLMLFGLSGIAIYKAINTMDSMIGYRTVRYEKFGKVAARLDDVANYIPARLTAMLIALLMSNKKHSLQILWRDGHKLDSPNAGYPIAALAGSLQISLGGAAHYHGKLKLKPTLGNALQSISQTTIQQALALRWRLDLAIFVFFSIAISNHF
ncbi:MAG: adenosylcobinamide-phosphate synthase CbiB [Methylococcales bacterium]|nr:adenosylcobinamide-phosphate synthase CbiB [Methylococcales bacterium]